MNKRIKIDDLEAEVMKSLKDYVTDAQDIVKDAVKKAGDDAKKQLQENSPKDRGKYAKSWAVKTTKESTSELGVVVHSRKLYGLTHLLEKGHAKRGGGRVPAKVHIAPVEQEVTTKLEEDIKKGLS